jgi:predicted hotdog family 3-hydroxylacyl-ACP dehydratase
MLPDHLSIEDLLPHRARMLLIQEVVQCEGETAVTRNTVKKEWPLTDSSGADPLIIVELVAQTAGMKNGLLLRRERGPNADQRGWIVGIKSARFFVERLPIGTSVVVETQNRFEFEEFREIEGVAKIGDTVAAQVALQVIKAAPQEQIP